MPDGSVEKKPLTWITRGARRERRERLKHTCKRTVEMEQRQRGKHWGEIMS